MRIKILIAVVAVAVIMAACSTPDQPTSLVANAGFVPYYTDLAEARAAAAGNQHLVVEFYTDW